MIISKVLKIRTLRTHSLSLSLSLSRRYTFGLSLSLSLSRRYTFGKTQSEGGWGGGGGVIVQAAKPKAAIMPVPFGLAVELGHVVG